MKDNDNMPTPLNSAVISEHCRGKGYEIDVEVLEIVNSTNTRLLESDTSSPVVLCAAEHQTVGRGRRGKTWHSPDSGVTFSMRFNRSEPLSWFNGLSLLVGAALCDSLREFGISEAMVKWPNDVLVNGSKLAGILIELRTTTSTIGSNKATVLVVGMGINYKRGEEARLIDQSFTDLATLCQSTELPDRSMLIGDIAARLLAVVNGEVPDALLDLSNQWERYDALNQASVIAEAAGEKIHGCASGIDSSGHLQIETTNGVRHLNSADVTVRKYSSLHPG